jgi:integrase
VKNTENAKWEKTKVQFLLRNSQSGIYYARAFAQSKEVWKSMKTDVFSVAKARLGDFLVEVRQVGAARSTVKRGVATLEMAATVYLDEVQKRVDIKPGTKHYWTQIVKALLVSWPEFKDRKINKITVQDCQDWASTFAKNASPTRFNNTVDCLRNIFALAIREGLIFRNPAAGLGKVKIRGRHLELPSRKEFAQLVKAIRSNGAWCSPQCGDLAEFLAFTGARLGEAEHVKWSDVETEKGFLWIHGDPLTGTKKSERRQVPIIPALRRLLADLRANPRLIRDPNRQEADYVLAITECQKAIDEACRKHNLKRITHHDLRHLFATAAIESGIDIPTVSKWLGHRDGGALAMRVYGHLRRDHFRDAARKVKF